MQNKPVEVSDRTLTMLEWPAFLDFYSAFVTSPAARDEVHRLRPLTGLEQEWQLSSEALICAQKNEIPGFSGLENISSLLDRSMIQNQYLPGVELYRIFRLIFLNNEIRKQAASWKKDYPSISERIQRLPDLRNLQQHIESKIEQTGEVKENATPELTRLQKRISQLKSRVERSLEKYLKDSRYQTVLQENYVTYRHGRAVLLVRADQKNAIRGLVHGSSGSGASLFVEPFPILELNNELAEVTDQQAEEITRILKELTAMVGNEAELLKFVLRQLISLDLIFARGRFGKTFRGTIPRMSEDLSIRLMQARHPLLEDTLRKQNRNVVPLDLEIDASKKALVVTGPNTGGKTVLLKTMGLLSLIAHCAIPLPAGDESVVPYFSGIEADIGDQQSISESLSTFSSHISNIQSILSNLQEDSLVMLDELGTGTDPEEGAPLAVAILQELLDRRVKIVVTSHHSQLKVFAFNDPRCVPAAMEFDERNLQPTYRVHLDQIGSSHAFDIAERLGLPAGLLQRARSLTDERQLQLEEFQAKLQQRISDLTSSEQALEREKINWENQSREQQQRLESLEKKLESQLKTLREQNQDLIRTLSAKVEVLLGTIQDMKLRQELRKKYKDEVVPSITELQELTPTPEPTEQFQVGERVWVNLYREFGEVVGIKKGQADLIIRNKRFTVPVNTLERKESLQESLPKGVQVQFEEKQVEPELNLIGQTVEEALTEADKYLDDAFLGQLPEVRIIHGHGTGRLKRALEEMLQKHPHVQKFHPEIQQRGGGGVTVVELKSR